MTTESSGRDRSTLIMLINGKKMWHVKNAILTFIHPLNSYRALKWCFFKGSDWVKCTMWVYT